MTSTQIIAVVTINDPTFARPLAAVLQASRVDVVEVVLRTPESLAAIESMAEVEGLSIAAGTVTDPTHVHAAVSAGATIIVSPGLDDDVVDAARSRGVAAVPGVATPTDCQRAVRHGLSRVKLFPALVLGGTRMLDALAPPFPSLGFMPSGGVDLSNAPALARHPAVFAVASGWMADRALVEMRELDEIARRCRAFVDAVSLGLAPVPPDAEAVA